MYVLIFFSPYIYVKCAHSLYVSLVFAIGTLSELFTWRLFCAPDTSLSEVLICHLIFKPFHFTPASSSIYIKRFSSHCLSILKWSTQWQHVPVDVLDDDLTSGTFTFVFYSGFRVCSVQSCIRLSL